MLTTEARALLAAAATGVQVGAAIVATRYVIQDVGPMSLALLRYTIGFLCLIPFALAASRLRFSWADFLAVVGLGIVQFAVLIVLLNVGLKFVTSTRAALLFATMPLLTMVVASALGRERLTAAKTAGVVLTIVGVGATLGETLFSGAGANEWLGMLAVLGSALSGAVCSVLYRPYLARYPTLPLGALAMMASVVFLSGLAGTEDFFAHPPQLQAPAWAAVAFIGVSSGVGYMTWLWALKHTSPTRVTVFLALSPVTAALLGVGLLGEALTKGIVLGMLCVAGGLWMATRPASG